MCPVLILKEELPERRTPPEQEAEPLNPTTAGGLFAVGSWPSGNLRLPDSDLARPSQLLTQGSQASKGDAVPRDGQGRLQVPSTPGPAPGQVCSASTPPVCCSWQSRVWEELAKGMLRAGSPQARQHGASLQCALMPGSSPRTEWSPKTAWHGLTWCPPQSSWHTGATRLLTQRCRQRARDTKG